MKKWIGPFIVAIIVVSIGFFIFRSCQRPEMGDKVVITKNIYGATDELRHNMLDTYLRKGNSSMVKIMCNAGTVKQVYKGETGKIIGNYHNGRYEVLFDNDDLGVLYIEGHAIDKNER